MDKSHRKNQAQDGQALVEYALVLSLVSLVCVGGLTLIGENVSGVLSVLAGTL
jgi:Flp pilus assembly pilin Flp